MNFPQTGGCQCGAIRYEITEAPQLIYTCHCLDCQRLTSSAFSLGIVVPDTAFRLMGAEPRQLQRIADSGRVNTRSVCPECGSWIWADRVRSDASPRLSLLAPAFRPQILPIFGTSRAPESLRDPTWTAGRDFAIENGRNAGG
jgi:hypothetical protein